VTIAGNYDTTGRILAAQMAGNVTGPESRALRVKRYRIIDRRHEISQPFRPLVQGFRNAAGRRIRFADTEGRLLPRKAESRRAKGFARARHLRLHGTSTSA
jgi:hypothetical protein